MNPMTDANRQGWDKLAAVHSTIFHIDKLLSGEPLLNELIRSVVGEGFQASFLLMEYIGR